MLIRDGKLPDGEGHTDLEIDSAVSEYLFEQAGEKMKFSRVSNIMRRRWHTAEIQECRS